MGISQDGRFVYTRVPGYILLLTLAVDEETGKLKQIQEVPIEGIWPRSLNFSPDGNYLVCCCLEGQIIVCKVRSDGRLRDTGHQGFTKGAGGVSFFDPNLEKQNEVLSAPRFLCYFAAGSGVTPMTCF